VRTATPELVTPAEFVRRRRRTTELGLLVLAGLIIGGAYALASLGRNSSLPADVGLLLIGIFGLVVAAHLAVRRFAPAADALFLPLAALLNGLGYVFISRLNTDLAAKQLGWTLVGIGLFVLTLAVVRDIRVLQRYRYTFGLVGLVLLVLPLVPGIGRNINGSRIWVSIGPVSFQPGSSPRSRSPSSSPATSWTAESCWAPLRSASARSTCRTPGTSARCWWPGGCRSS